MSISDVVMKDLGDDLPASVQPEQRQQVDEMFGRNGALEFGQCRHGAYQVDGEHAVGARLAARRRGWASIHHGEVLVHAPEDGLLTHRCRIKGLRMKHLGQALCIAVVKAVEV